MKSLRCICHCWQRCICNSLSNTWDAWQLEKIWSIAQSLRNTYEGLLTLLQNLFYAFFSLFDRVCISFLSSVNWHTIIFSTATGIIISYTLPLDWISNSRVNKPRSSVIIARPNRKKKIEFNPRPISEQIFTLWSLRLLYDI